MWISHDDPKKWNDSSVLRSWWCILCFFFLTPLQETKTNLDASSDPSFLSRHICEHFTFLASPWNPASRRRRRSTACVESWLLFFFEVRNLLDDGGCWTSSFFNPKRICQIVKWSFLCPSYRPRTLKGGSHWITDGEDYTVLMPAELDRLDLIAWPWIVVHDRMDCTIFAHTRE